MIAAQQWLRPENILKIKFTKHTKLVNEPLWTAN